MTELRTAIAYSAAVETLEPDEAETVAGLNEQFRAIQETTAEDYGYAVRAVHAKGHAVVAGKLEVLAGLAPALAQGLFATPGSYDTLVRISTIAGDILDDAVSMPRGLAIKLFGVAGERLPGAEDATTQDFILVNHPAFTSSTPKAFLTNLKLLAKTTDRVEGLKKALSATLQVVDQGLEAIGVISPTVRTLGGAPNTNPLGESYYTQTPFRHGDHIAKLALIPVSANLTALTGVKVDTAGRPDALRDDIAPALAAGDAVWELRAQLCTDLDAMPIENASVQWDEGESPYRTVARLTVPAQASWQGGDTDPREQDVAFSPWHGLAAHRPLGGVNRVRKPTYAASSALRGQINGCPMQEPRSLADVDS